MEKCRMTTTVCKTTTPAERVADTRAAVKEFAKNVTPADLLRAFEDAELYHGGRIHGEILTCELCAFPLLFDDFSASVDMVVMSFVAVYKVHFYVNFSGNGGGCSIEQDRILWDVERFVIDK